MIVMKGKNVKIFAKVIVCLCLGYLVMLAVYIKLTLPTASASSQPTVLLCRIDLPTSMAIIESRKLQQYATQIAFTKRSFLNEKDNILVVTYLQGFQTASKIINSIQAHTKSKLLAYKPTMESAAKGCPITLPQDGFTFQYLFTIRKHYYQLKNIL